MQIRFDVTLLFNRLAVVWYSYKVFIPLLLTGSLTEPAESNSLLRQIVRQILAPASPKTPTDSSGASVDLEHHSSGILKDLLKSSFSYFMGAAPAKPKPSDAPGE